MMGALHPIEPVLEETAMTRRIRAAACVLALALAFPVSASAGMASFTLADLARALRLTDMTRMRLEAISFFGLGLLVCAGVVQWIWNSLRKDFTRLPRLSYGKACGIIILWGLLFVIVLTMISGARELLTPGAWKKSGLTYHLADDAAEAASRQITGRYQAIQRFHEAIARYAEAHDRYFPPADPTHAIPVELRGVATFPGQSYHYLGGHVPDGEFPISPTNLLLYEGDAFGADRLVLRMDHQIVWMPATEIEAALKEKSR
jgi:hypothetical protein